MGLFSGIGSIVGGALGAVGSIFGAKEQREAQSDANAQSQAQFEANLAAQKEFAQQGIRWKVEDAKAAGLHPLAALGTNTTAYTPMFSNIGAAGGSGIGEAISHMGQGIGRAIDAKATARERAVNEAKRHAMDQLQLENMELQNRSLRADIALQQARASQLAINTAQQVPAMPSFNIRSDGAVIPGQANATSSSLWKHKPAEITYNDPHRVSATAGSVPEVTFTRTADGGYGVIASQDAKEGMEDNLAAEIGWAIRNYLVPFVGGNPIYGPSSALIGEGKEPHFDRLRMGWYPLPRGSRAFFDSGLPLKSAYALLNQVRRLGGFKR